MSGALVVIDTGSANLASVSAAFRRLGVSASITSDADRVRSADRVVLPGVGAFGDVSARLSALGLDAAIVERAEAGRPFLAICLGMQLLARTSDEAPGVAGLGIIDATVRRFSDDVSVPQLGWNRVTASAGTLVREGFAYFANSYYLDVGDADWMPSAACHGQPFVAALERGSQLACQFHPELSGAWGSALLERWYREC
jgi:glutamine amidotransferase